MQIRTFIGFAPALAATVAANAGTIIEVPADQPTIQAGINAASNGDSVRVAPGTYPEFIDFLGKSISVHSSDGAAVTIIDVSTIPNPGTGNPVVRFDSGEGPDSALLGFTITGGTGSSEIFGPGLPAGGGILMRDTSPTIIDCVITGNTAELGAGVFVDGASPTFKDCMFEGNDAFVSGNAGIGGGLYLFFSGATITDCEFANNTAGEQSAGINVNSNFDAVRITGTTFTNNTSDGTDGGCIEAHVVGGLIIDSCVFDDNSIQQGDGGAIRLIDGDITILNSVFSGNRVNQVGGLGGALYLEGDSAFIANSLFHSNGAQLRGGAVLADNIDIDIINCTFSENDSKDGSALYIQRDSGSSALLTNNIVWNNFGALDQIAATFSGGPLTVNHSIVQGGWSGAGSHNSDTDPLFTDPAASDFSLLPASPAIDAGDTLAAAAAFSSESDIAGNPRLTDDPAEPNSGVQILGSTIDIGAHEALPADEPACLADLNADGILDLADIGLFVSTFTAGCP